MPKRYHLLAILLIVALTMPIYANSLSNGFVYDDNTVIGGIKQVNDLYKLFTQEYFNISGELSYRPIVTFSYFLDYTIFESCPWGYHFTNLLIHTSNGILLYLLLIRLSTVNSIKNISLFSLGGTILFISHPVMTEAVNGISFREDLLASFFYMAAFNLYISLRSNPFSVHLLYVASCLLYLLALLSKEMAITLPLALIVWEILLARRDKGRTYLKRIERISGFVVVTLIYLFIRFYYFSIPIDGRFQFRKWSLAESLLTLPATMLSYIKLTTVPVSLSADYPVTPLSTPFTISFILPLVIFLSTGFLIYRLGGERDAMNALFVFGILFFFITLLPVSNLVPIFNPMAERYMYLPMTGACIVVWAVACYIYSNPKWKRYLQASGVIFALIIISFSIASINRNRVWENDYTLWVDAVRKAPNSIKAHYGLGNAYRDRFLIDSAIREYQSALRLNPDIADVRASLGACYLQKRLLDKAQAEYEEVLKISPGDRLSAYNLAIIYFQRGLYIEALNLYRRLSVAAPDDRFTKNMIEDILKKLGTVSEDQPARSP